jgi:hypothetical protein
MCFPCASSLLRAPARSSCLQALVFPGVQAVREEGGSAVQYLLKYPKLSRCSLRLMPPSDLRVYFSIPMSMALSLFSLHQAQVQGFCLYNNVRVYETLSLVADSQAAEQNSLQGEFFEHVSALVTIHFVIAEVLKWPHPVSIEKPFESVTPSEVSS